MTTVSPTRLRTLTGGLAAALLMALLVQIPGQSVRAQTNESHDNRIGIANYELAEQWTSAKLSRRTYSTSVRPGWLEHSDRFWYRWQNSDGSVFYIVDPGRRTRAPLFDPAHMAAELSRLTRDPYDAQHLPINSIEFIDRDTAFRFSVRSTTPAAADTGKTEEEEEEEREEEQEETERTRGRRGGGSRVIRPSEVTLWFRYDLNSRQLTLLEDYEEPERPPSWAEVAPDSSVAIFARDHNLWMMDKENFLKTVKDDEDSTIVEIQLTDDGEEDYSFGSAVRRGMDEEEQEEARQERARARVTWSPDSRKFVVSRTDQRRVEDLWVIHNTADPRPTLETYKYAMPGEEELPQTEVWIFDVVSRERTAIQIELYKDQTVSVHSRRQPTNYDPRAHRPSIWLSENPDEIFISRLSRDMHKGDVCIADATTGEVRVVIEERLNTYIETQRLEYLPSTEELIWWSERTGWGHYYLYGTDGTLKGQITGGPWSCRRIHEIDEENRTIYFTANAREAGEDPYFEHFYKVKLDGSGLTLLNAGNFTHSASLDPELGFFVDNYSRVDVAPQAALYNNRGEKLMDLEEADLSQLFAAGYEFPEAFEVKADDGVTDIYGVMYKPFDFDPERRYPIIAYVYPGPQTESVAKSWSTSSTTTSLAQFGFIVITVGNRGGHPNRSKWYHNYSYGDLRDYGLADKKTAIEQLAARHSFIDIDRVGIFGHSGGGFMSTAALLVYPDFFHVAVSSAGNHENNIYNKWWSEKHHGVTEVITEEGEVQFEYDIDRNSQLAENLKGHLLIVHGDVDNNVHPANTIRLANALIQANKRFDMFIFPGQRHGFGSMNNYFFWMRADYFCRHLIGDYAHTVDMIELTRDIDQSPDAGRRNSGGRGR